MANPSPLNGRDVVFSIHLPKVLSDLVPVGLAFAMASLMLLGVGTLFAAVGAEPFGDAFSNHLREVAVLAGLAFSLAVGAARYASRVFETAARAPAALARDEMRSMVTTMQRGIQDEIKALANHYEGKFDSTAAMMASAAQTQERIATTLGKMDGELRLQAERVAWLFGQSGQPLEAVPRIPRSQETT